MPNPAIPRDEVHALAEACGEQMVQFQPVASRLLRDQKPLVNFLRKNAAHIGAQEAEVTTYMLAVILRIFEQVGGRMHKVSASEAQAAADRISAIADQLLPFDAELPARVRAVAWRAQPHILDEVLWALYERKEDKKEGEVDVEPRKAALITLALWACTEALDQSWRPPAARA